MQRCQRMDLTAENRVMTLTVKQTAPPISIAAALADLVELPSYNIYSPRTDRVADKRTSKGVDTLLIGRPQQDHAVPCPQVFGRARPSNYAPAHHRYAWLVLAIVTLSFVATLASFLPAYRASKLDPLTALRYD